MHTLKYHAQNLKQNFESYLPQPHIPLTPVQRLPKWYVAAEKHSEKCSGIVWNHHCIRNLTGSPSRNNRIFPCNFTQQIIGIDMIFFHLSFVTNPTGSEKQSVPSQTPLLQNAVPFQAESISAVSKKNM